MAKNNDFSFLQLYEVVNPKNREQTNFKIVTNGVISQLEEKNRNDGSGTFWRAKLPINNQAKRVNYMFGTDFPEDDTIWANVTFAFENVTERFLKCMQDRNTLMCSIITGTVWVSSYCDNSGSERPSLHISIEDFKVVFPKNNDQDSGNGNGGGYGNRGGQNGSNNMGGNYGNRGGQNGGSNQGGNYGNRGGQNGSNNQGGNYGNRGGQNGGSKQGGNYGNRGGNNGGYGGNSRGGYNQQSNYQPPAIQQGPVPGRFEELDDDDGNLPF